MLLLEHKISLVRIEALLLFNSETRNFNLQVGDSNAYTPSFQMFRIASEYDLEKHNNILYTNQRHREEESHNTNSYIMKTIKVKRSALSSPSG